jgi:chemotaxis protein MotB
MRREVGVRLEPEGLIISLREIGFFASGSASIKPQAVAAVVRIASVLHDHDCAVRIEGHTDTVPVHNTQFASNWELSTARATGLVKILVQKYGIPPDKLSAAGFAEYHPVASNATSEGQQMNRRVDFVITAAETTSVPTPKPASIRKPVPRDTPSSQPAP